MAEMLNPSTGNGDDPYRGLQMIVARGADYLLSPGVEDAITETRPSLEAMRERPLDQDAVAYILQEAAFAYGFRGDKVDDLVARHTEELLFALGERDIKTRHPDEIRGAIRQALIILAPESDRRLQDQANLTNGGTVALRKPEDHLI